jgi:regulatory protein
MAKITALAPQKRNKERVNVHLDGEYAFALTLTTAFGLYVGQEITPEKQHELQIGDVNETAKQSAFHFISYRPRSEAELRKNLRGKGFDDAVVDAVVERLTELEMLDDWAFARYWIEQRESFKPRSRMALRQELFQKGIKSNIIDETVTEIDEMSSARRATTNLANRWAHLPRQEFTVKIGGYLKRRGFNYEIIADVVQEHWTAFNNSAE